MKHLVIVESPTKAKTIQNFLGKNYEIKATYGHIRDLPKAAAEIPASIKKEPWATLGVNIDDDFKPVYVVPKDKKKVIAELKASLKESDELILATDEDREGESISWHVFELLKPKIRVKRMVFHEITQEAIDKAIENCREIDANLVKAQEARRILDRLVGYMVSPLLWKKISTGLSAGRVQSVALKQIVEQEWRRIRFVKSEYWDLKAELKKDRAAFPAALSHYKGKKTVTGKDFDERTGELIEPGKVARLSQTDAIRIREEIENTEWRVEQIEEKKISRSPAPPFTTSSLQQEANRKLKFASKETMRVAQGLYEKGFITYMRTDSISLSDQAVEASRNEIRNLYGKDHLPPKPRTFKSKSKNAQEAHEAIRPAGSSFAKPEECKLSGRELELYTLIWKRTIASQMKNAELTLMGVKIAVGDCLFRASGKKIDFPGFFRAYVEGSDDPEASLDERETILPAMAGGDALTPKKVETVSHETKPAARYTEASLVKVLEENGVGRPSTYASIIGTIIERGYVQKMGEALVPSFTAFSVTNLLEDNFGNLVDVGFTSKMEQALDDISLGKKESLPYLKSFFKGKNGLQSLVEEKTENIAPGEYREIKLPGIKAKVLIGKYGPYIEAERDGESINSSIPHNVFPADLTQEKVDGLIRNKGSMNNELGLHPTTNQPIYLLTGAYGPYVQLGETVAKGEKPKRISIPKDINESDVGLEVAVKLLSLPRNLGVHPEQGGAIQAHIGRFGPYVVHTLGENRNYRSLKKEDSVIEVSLDRALELLNAPKQTRSRSVEALKTLGEHPADNKPIALHKGPYGPYIKYNMINIAIPKNVDWENLTLEDALGLIEHRKENPPAKRKTTKRKTPMKKKPAS